MRYSQNPQFYIEAYDSEIVPQFIDGVLQIGELLIFTAEKLS